MRNLRTFGFLAVAICALSSAPSAAQAYTAPYNPHNIIRDDIFVNPATMSAGDIQNFLVSKGSCLATASPESLNSSQTAAQIIAQAAATANGGRGINPQVILTTLQKEWSLVTKSCAQLEAIYGGYSGGPQVFLKRALGYNVPDVLGIGDCLYSFSAQLLGTSCSGTGYAGGPTSMRNAFEQNKVGPGGTYAYPSSFTVQEYSDRIGDLTVSPRSKATAVLYRYTPYAYYGNYNFFTIFQGWFGNPVCATNLEVIKVSGGAESSVLFENVRYPIASMEALRAWGLDCNPVTYIDPSVYYSYSVGPLISRVIKEQDGARVYIMSDGTRRHIRTSFYVEQVGLLNEPYSQLPAALIGEVPEGNPMGYLVKAMGKPEIYLAQTYSKYYITDTQMIEAWGFDMSDLVEVSPLYLEALPTIGNLSILVKGSAPEIYVASLRSFVYAPSLARLRDWNMQSLPVTIIDDAFIQSLPKRGVLSRVTRGSGTQVYYIATKKRYHVTRLSTAISLEQQYGELTAMSDVTIASVPFAGKK